MSGVLVCVPFRPLPFPASIPFLSPNQLSRTSSSPRPQLASLDKTIPGGLHAYLAKAKTLLAGAAKGASPFLGCRVSVPDGARLPFGSPQFDDAEATGIAHIADCAFVLVAGGLGERLGYSGIKVALPAETTTGCSYLELYIQSIVALQRRGGALRPCPLAIMTSDDTHAATAEYLEANNYFGMRLADVTLLKQDKVPALQDNDGRMAMESPYRVACKPHGHGDVHGLLLRHGVAAKWQARGAKWVVFLQDTNAMAFMVAVATLGVSVDRNLDINAACLPRLAGEAVGVIAVVDDGAGDVRTTNIEYNQLDDALRASTGVGDVNDPTTGRSRYPGNTNTLIYKLGTYLKALEASGGVVPEFVNPKYADASKTVFAKSTRLECTMQDFSRIIPATCRVQYTLFDDWIYAPNKNSIAEARKKLRAGLPLQCAASSEMAQYAAHCKYLAAAGVVVPPAQLWDVSGLQVNVPPRVVLCPAFAPTVTDVRAKFPAPSAVTLTQRSTLVVDGADVTIHHLDLDGTLVIKACVGASVTVRRLVVRNAGWPMERLGCPESGGAGGGGDSGGVCARAGAGGAAATSADEKTTVRGFTIRRSVGKANAKVLLFSHPGSYVVDEE